MECIWLGKTRSQKQLNQGLERGDIIMTNSGINKRSALLAILCVLVMVFAVPVANAASYSKVYGQTQDKVRVRESASTNATIIDNIVKDACIYITSSRRADRTRSFRSNTAPATVLPATGWVCQSDGHQHLREGALHRSGQVEVQGEQRQSAQQGGWHVHRGRRKASAANSDTTYIAKIPSGAAVSKVQTELKALGCYYGQITGNAGPKTVAAIKSFQGKNGLTADGIAGRRPSRRLTRPTRRKGGSSSGSGFLRKRPQAQVQGGTDVRNLSRI